MNSNSNDFFEWGKVLKTAAFKGHVIVAPDVDDIEKYKKLYSIYIFEEGAFKELKVLDYELNKNKTCTVLLEGYNNYDAALTLQGRFLYLPVSLLEAKTGNDFYFHEIVGFELTDTVSGLKGSVNGINEISGNTYFEAVIEGVQCLIPVVKEWVVSINREMRSIAMALPEDLIRSQLTEE